MRVQSLNKVETNSTLAVKEDEETRRQIKWMNWLPFLLNPAALIVTYVLDPFGSRNSTLAIILWPTFPIVAILWHGLIVLQARGRERLSAALLGLVNLVLLTLVSIFGAMSLSRSGL